MLLQLDHLPTGLLELDAAQLEGVLGGPTLIHLPGRREPNLFVSVLMHGNETTGWDALRQLLRRYRHGGGELELPRGLSLFVGNVSAAALGLRHLDGQPDYNRVWPGCGSSETPEHRMMSQVLETMRERGVFASVDVHNNTGFNPHYACVNRLDNRFFHLATMFSRTVVYFIRPCGVQSIAMVDLCPSVTLECGRVGQARSVEHARDYLDACLHLSEHPVHAVAHHDIELFHTVAIVKVPERLSFGYGVPNLDINFAEDLDHFNFRELPSGTVLGSPCPDIGLGLEVTDEHGEDVSERYFELEDGELRLRVPVMPSMLTLDHRVVRQDCLCYLMERYNDHLE
ncbi:MAG: peptidase M14 [Gammaproteobacteria bacterium]|nr:peptidase M14 [Gammaproteobacteria bacterium]